MAGRTASRACTNQGRQWMVDRVVEWGPGRCGWGDSSEGWGWCRCRRSNGVWGWWIGWCAGMWPSSKKSDGVPVCRQYARRWDAGVDDPDGAPGRRAGRAARAPRPEPVLTTDPAQHPGRVGGRGHRARRPSVDRKSRARPRTRCSGRRDRQRARWLQPPAPGPRVLVPSRSARGKRQ